MQPETTDSEFSFKILGPLEITAEGKDVPITGTRQRTLLTLLLLDVGRPVGHARLIDGVWGGRAPRTAEAQLRICVSRLRRRLTEAGLPDAIATESHGYRLTVPEDRVDVPRFRILLDRAGHAEASRDDTEAVRLLCAALALWRGPAAEGLTSPLVRAAAARLDEERASALERRFGMELRLGRHHRVVPELAAGAAEHPFRENLHYQLMTALYHTGRQADALNVYRELRRRLADEMGIDPSQRLRALESKILEQNPELDGNATGLPRDARVRLAALERENASLHAERQRIGRLVVGLMGRHDPPTRPRARRAPRKPA
ncbi:BTAD domain-containing putative transcriptional regulator [Streptomyces sp. NPDC056503]|uniref:AfsR/SARP family transcriptional regulator n=1 Tax=Streptomyces sp. NPDC056503 TaxID=3345842 RepID=UPI003693C49A